MSRWLIAVVSTLFFLPMGCQSADQDAMPTEGAPSASFTPAQTVVMPPIEVKPVATPVPNLLGLNTDGIVGKMGRLPDQTDMYRLVWDYNNKESSGWDLHIGFDQNKRVNRVIATLTTPAPPTDVIPSEIWDTEPVAKFRTTPGVRGGDTLVVYWLVDGKGYLAELQNSVSPVFETETHLDNGGSLVSKTKPTGDFRACDKLFQYGYQKGPIKTNTYSFDPKRRGGELNIYTDAMMLFDEFPK